MPNQLTLDSPTLKNLLFKGFPLLIVLLVWLLSCQHPFFWDTIQLSSRQAQWYYDQQFQQFLLPDEIDSGHPSGFGMYLAGIWLLFGQNLLVSHVAILLLLILILLGIFRLSKILNGYWSIYLPFFLVLDPVFLGQASLVSPDVALLAFFIWGLIGGLQKRYWLLMFCTIGLASISLRGMMAVLALYLFQIFSTADQSWRKPKTWVQHLWPFLPAGLLALAFLAYHSWAKSWVGFHADSPWRESFNVLGFKGVLKNSIILGWRVADYGRIFLCLALVGLWIKLGKNWKGQPFFALLLITFFIQVPHFLLFQGVNAHRYLMPFFLALALFFLQVLQQSQIMPRSKRLIVILVLCGLASGNFWLYPNGLAQGWDSTPRHWPHFALRQQVIDHLDAHQIPLEKVGTTFPEIGPLHWRDLSKRQDGFNSLNLQQNEYVYYSSVMNDFSDQERAVLFDQWQKVLVLKKAGIHTVLFKKP